MINNDYIEVDCPWMDPDAGSTPTPVRDSCAPAERRTFTNDLGASLVIERPSLSMTWEVVDS